MTLLLQRITSGVLSRLYLTREWVISILVIGVGMGLAFGLSSPLQALTIAVAGVSVYCLLIVIAPLKGLLLWMVTQILLDGYLNISLGDGIPDLSLTRLCIALISVLLVARTAIRHQRLQPVNKFDVLAFLFMVGIMQSGPRGLRGIASIQNVFDLYWVPVLTYFAVKNLVTNQKSVHLVLYAVLFVALYSAVYAIYETTTGNILFYSGKKEFLFYDDDMSMRILHGIWGLNVGFGSILVMGLPINFYFYLKTSSPTRKVIWAICLGLIFVGLFLTYKRAAWLSMLAVMLAMQFFYPQFRRLFIVILVVVVVALAFNWDRISTSKVYTDRINDKVSTAEVRTKRWEVALELWRARPLLGYGFSQYDRLAANDQGYVGIESEFLSVLVSAGLVGFLPYIGLLLLMGYDGFQHYRGRVTDSLADRDLVAVFWGELIGYAVNTSTAIVIHLIIPSMLFAMAGAILYARRSPSSRLSEIEMCG